MIYVIVGPTGVGKTKLCIALAKKLNAEIINADSMQVYRGLDIGTAKVKETEKEGIPHHLFDTLDVHTCYTVYDYQKDARKKVEEIISRGKNVILVGGTGLYIRSCLYDYQFQEEEKQETFDDLSNEELLENISTYMQRDSIPVHPNNRKRLVRLLNRLQNGDVDLSKKSEPIYDFYMIGLTTSRETLYEKINERVDSMVEEGLFQEVEALYKNNIHSKAVETGIGYKELYRYFEGKCTKEEAIEEVKKNSRHYAKRQYTFFKHQFPVHWFETDYVNFDNAIQAVLKKIEGRNS